MAQITNLSSRTHVMLAMRRRGELSAGNVWQMKHTHLGPDQLLFANVCMSNTSLAVKSLRKSIDLAYLANIAALLLTIDRTDAEGN